MKILITGGSGFVGSNIAIYLKKNLKGVKIYSLDNLSRKGSTINKKRLLKHKIKNYKLNIENFKVLDNQKKGLGGAINLGIKESSGSSVAIMMADQSDDINDLIKYNSLINTENCDAILGSRFLKESKVLNYPIQKLVLNRIFNYFVGIIFWNKYNDYTNAFKIYKKKTLEEISPLISESFNIFLEIPLKIISRKYKYKIIPINWNGRTKGVSKFKIRELRSKYLFTLIYCFIEKNLLNIKK